MRSKRMRWSAPAVQSTRHEGLAAHQPIDGTRGVAAFHEALEVGDAEKSRLRPGRRRTSRCGAEMVPASRLRAYSVRTRSNGLRTPTTTSRLATLLGRDEPGLDELRERLVLLAQHDAAALRRARARASSLTPPSSSRSSVPSDVEPVCGAWSRSRPMSRRGWPWSVRPARSRDACPSRRARRGRGARWAARRRRSAGLVGRIERDDADGRAVLGRDGLLALGRAAPRRHAGSRRRHRGPRVISPERVDVVGVLALEVAGPLEQRRPGRPRGAAAIPRPGSPAAALPWRGRDGAPAWPARRPRHAVRSRGGRARRAAPSGCTCSRASPRASRP